MSTSPVVLHLIDSLGLGGAQQRLINDLKYLNGVFDHRVYTLFPENEGFEEKLQQLKIPTFCLGLRSPTDLLLGVHRLAQVLRRDRTIGLIHSQLFFADIVGRVAGWLCGCPVITTAQSAVYEPDSGLNSSWRRWLDQWTGRRVYHFVAVSEFVKQSLHSRLRIPLDKISVIPNSIDVQLVMPDSSRRKSMRKQLELREEGFVWVTVGRLNPQKGYRYLLEGMAQVLCRFPMTRLLIVGEGPDRTSLERLSQALGFNNKVVQFLGERKDVVALLDASDGFVFPSLSEGLPIALLEAMAMGKPCVASSIGPHEELIEHGGSGLLVSPQDPMSLAKAMCEIQGNAAWRKVLGERARKRAAERFNATSWARDLGRLYADLIAWQNP